MRLLTMLALAALPIAAAAQPSAGETKAQLCMLCHNVRADGVPLLEAQPAPYLVAAIRAYQTGARKDAQQMQPNVERLSRRDIAQIADYFASRPLAPPAPAADPKEVTAGAQRVAESGCVVCHQTNFRGRELVPRLAGQSRRYLVSQLEAFALGRRPHPAAAMPGLDPAAIQSVASYLSSL